MERKLASIYYSPRGYWKGTGGHQKPLSRSRPRTGSRSRPSGRSICLLHGTSLAQSDVSKPNEVHQADLLFLLHDRVGTFRYALTLVDVASRYKEAEPLTSKTAAEVADALSRIFRRGSLKWPKLLQVDPGREFMGVVSQVLRNTGSRSGAIRSIFTGTKESWNASTGRWLNASSGTSMPRRCGSLRARGYQSGLSDCPQLSQL